jgi:hypothetical protein
MIYPRFNGDSFWNYKVTAELFGARYPTIPLGDHARRHAAAGVEDPAR